MAVLDTIWNQLKKPSVLPILGAAGGGALAGGPSTVTNMPVEPEGYKGIGDLLRARATARLSQPFDTAGYEAGGIQNVNDAFSGANMALQNKLTSSGLASSPVAGAANANFETGRAGSIAKFLNTIPEIQRQADMQDFGQVADFYNSRPLGQTQTSTGAGGRLGGAGSGVLEMLGQLYGQGAFGGGGAGGKGQNLIGALPGFGAAAAGGELLPGTQAALGQISIPGMEAVGPPLAGPAAAEGAAAGSAPVTAGGGAGGSAGGGALAAAAPYLPFVGAGAAALYAIETNQKKDVADRLTPIQTEFDQKPNKTLQDYQGWLQTIYNFATSGASGYQVAAKQALETFKKYYGDPSKYGVNIVLPKTGWNPLMKPTDQGSFSIAGRI